MAIHLEDFMSKEEIDEYFSEENQRRLMEQEKKESLEHDGTLLINSIIESLGYIYGSRIFWYRHPKLHEENIEAILLSGVRLGFTEEEKTKLSEAIKEALLYFRREEKFNRDRVTYNPIDLALKIYELYPEAFKNYNEEADHGFCFGHVNNLELLKPIRVLMEFSKSLQELYNYDNEMFTVYFNEYTMPNLSVKNKEKSYK